MNAEFVKALAKVQAELPAIRKTGENPHFRSKFAPLDEVNPAALAVLTRHGFAWVTMPKLSAADGTPVLEYRLMHECGDELVGEMPLMMKAQGPQEQGSAITYARRYSIQAVLGLVTDEDDDGHAASQQPKRAQKQGQAKTQQANTQWEMPPWNKGAWMDTVQGSTTKEQLAGLWQELAHAVSARSVEEGSQELADLEYFWTERKNQVLKESAA